MCNPFAVFTAKEEHQSGSSEYVEYPLASDLGDVLPEFRAVQYLSDFGLDRCGEADGVSPARKE